MAVSNTRWQCLADSATTELMTSGDGHADDVDVDAGANNMVRKIVSESLYGVKKGDQELKAEGAR
jgi:hypothetical protein